MSVLLLILLSTAGLSLITLVSVVLLALNKKTLDKFVFGLVALAAGTMLGGAFLHLLPDALESLPAERTSKLVLFSIIGFYILEKFMHWHHSRHDKGHLHSLGYMNLAGDMIHNFIDGLIIAGAFITDINLGVVTLVALALHEIPQELSDFGVLIYAGFGRKKAILVNFLTGVASIFGGLVGYYLSYSVDVFVAYLLPVAAGGFIYIATSDLVPELRKETSPVKSFLAICLFLLGIAVIFSLGIVE